MKDNVDTRTRTSSGARRQAAYAERQRAAGRRQHAFWLTEYEAAQMAAYLTQLRQSMEAK